MKAPPKRIAITGATRGLGVALVRDLLLASSGAHHVLLTGRDAAAAHSTGAALRTELKLHGSMMGSPNLLEVYPAPLDMSDSRSVAAFAHFSETWGGVDVLVNNAAVCPVGWTRDAALACWRTNVLGPLLLSQALLPGMLRRRSGHIINVSSGDGELVYLSPGLQAALDSARTERAVLRVLAQAAPPRDAFGPSPAYGPTPAYSTSKAALNVLTRLGAAALPPPEESGVRLSAVCPGDVQTRMLDRSDPLAWANALPPATAARDVVRLAMARRAPSGRFWRHGREIRW